MNGWENIQTFILNDPWATIQTIILIISVGILIWQLQAIRKATALEGFNNLAELLNNEEYRNARRLLYKNKDKTKLNEKEDLSIRKLIVLMDQMGCLVNRKLIPERVAIDMYWDVVIKCWDAGLSWIEKDRKQKKNQDSAPKTFYYRIPIFLWITNLLTGLKRNSGKIFAAIWYKNVEDFRYFPKQKPIVKSYADSHYENFEMLVWRCERYCIKRRLDRPTIYEG